MSDNNSNVHLLIPKLCTAVSNIFLTSSLSLQFFIWIIFFQSSFMTTKVGIISTKYSFAKSGATSASILIKGTSCSALSWSAKGISYSQILSFFLIKSRITTPLLYSNTNWILSFDLAVVLMTTINEYE